jgi:hypothetical protein
VAARVLGHRHQENEGASMATLPDTAEERDMEDWTVDWLKSIGFEGFVALRSVGTSVPSAPGTYVVLSDGTADPSFAAVSQGGWFKGRNPAVAVDQLASKWVHGAQVVYIGQGSNLRRRISQLARFGLGHPVGHWGGRYLWQLDDCADLTIAWRRDDEPTQAETALLSRFVARHGRLPFANLR